MASNIFRNIIQQKIDMFASAFGSGAKNIFTKDNKLFHSLEYGMYKERCAKELLSYALNKSVGISDGFLITSKNNVSTQCDIILYKKDTIPLIDNGIANFFPIEIVKGIGEIKSRLNKAEFSKALIKLAQNKMLFEERTGVLKSDSRTFKENNEIFSFLICNDLSFNVSEIDFEEVYGEISVRYRHNVILSLQNGVLGYSLTPLLLPQMQKERFIKKGGNINCSSLVWKYPHHTEEDECYVCTNKFVKIDNDDKYKHIIDFLIIIKALTNEIYEYDFDFVEYLTNNSEKVFN